MKVENKSFWAVLFLGIVLLTLQLENITLRAVDAPIYASMGKELLAKTLIDWAQITWRGGVGFYDNPHFTPWLIAVSFKLFGVSAFAAALPIVIISIFSIIAIFFLGREIVNERFAILCMLALILCPQFLKDGRNPMLEPAIMFFTTISIYFGIKSLSEKNVPYALLGGFSTAFAFLSKGPMSFLSFGVIPAFFMILNLIDKNSKFKCSLKDFIKYFSLFILSFILLLAIVDLWHYLVFHQSFLKLYYQERLTKTLGFQGTTTYRMNMNHFYYINLLLKKYWPWIPLCIISPIFFFRKNKTEFRPALILGLLITFGYLIPFSFITFKASWYINIMHVCLALLSAVTLYQIKHNNLIEQKLPLIILSISIVILFLSSTYPTIFLNKRPFHQFLIQVSRTIKPPIVKGSLCSTIITDPWPFEFLNRFYLGQSPSNCNDGKTYDYRLIDFSKTKISNEEIIIFANHPYALLKTN